ncbi:site-specific DNA-methyltransferase [Helicobacter sp. MIT 99-5507]|uniref:site-specific DNA-methyltransferase n=1 Tax=Helicobacter sp. MIT 99-5507 TaxID=152489 RepID=UPI0015F147FA|nr:site-specific DNA-methyltransferase [Helicobacter sp. MIT 99-5507]
MNYKLEFYSRLESSYLGSKIKDIKDKNGFTNLLEIKAKYFKHLKSKLENFIGADTHENQDIYNKLYTFFDTYLNETGTPFFNNTPIYKNIYARVYSNSSDTSLFYKTQDLYYVKSDKLYKSMEFEGENYILKFDASEYKQNTDNTKNKIIFKFAGVESINGETNDEGKAQILIKVSNQKDLFPELNNVFKQNSNEFSEEFLKDLRQNEILKSSKIKINEEELKKIFRSYKKQSEIDFFIHKNAREFLNEQFDLWLFSYLHKDDKLSDFTQETLAKITKIKDAAKLTIDLIADFEDELKAVWLKPKFAKKTEYVFSLDVILNQIVRSANLKSVVGVGGEFERGEGATSRSCEALTQTCTFKPIPSLIKEFLGLITNDKGFESQIKEWQELNLIDEDFNKEDLLSNNTYRYLPIDTKHFSKETKYKILSSFENLESLLNGELIKADNFQALNTLMPKYQGKVDLIYIDPPYNTGSDGFIYADNFNHASWLSMMNNRLELSKELLNDKGSMFISIDDKEQARLKLVCDEVFGEENFVANFVWEKKGGRQNDAKFYSVNHEYILNYSKNLNFFTPNLLQRTDEMLESYKNPDNDPRGVWTSITLQAKSGSENMRYKVVFPNGVEWESPIGTYPRFTKEKIIELYNDNRLWFGENKKIPRG